MYSGTPDIIVSNLSVILCPNEKDLERFDIVCISISMKFQFQLQRKFLEHFLEEFEEREIETERGQDGVGKESRYNEIGKVFLVTTFSFFFFTSQISVEAVIFPLTFAFFYSSVIKTTSIYPTCLTGTSRLPPFHPFADNSSPTNKLISVLLLVLFREYVSLVYSSVYPVQKVRLGREEV